MSTLINMVQLVVDLVINSLQGIVSLLLMIINIGNGVIGWLAFAPAFLTPIMLVVCVAGVIKWFFGR